MTTELSDAGVRMPLQRAAVDERQAMRAVELELQVEFPAVPVDELTTLVTVLWAHFDGASVRDFVPLLVRKQAKKEMRDHLGRVEATSSSSDPSTAARPRLAP